MPKVNTVKKAQKDYPENGIKKGDTYYWWKFRYGGKRMSEIYPRPSQLTQSDFLSTAYSIQESIADFEPSDMDELKTFVEDTIEQLEQLRDEQEEKKDNMPESLQQGPTGELLQERYDALDEVINALNEIQFDGDDEELENSLEELKNIDFNC